MDQRTELFALLDRLGLNTYIYAPKDDSKHRAYWRELYSVEEAEHLTNLINEAKENNIVFVYALSPGLDITFSSSKEVTCLKRKLEQVSQFGCEAFALLFDDIDKDMNVADKEVFQSFAQAQVSVTNEAYQYLNQPSFFFCPTEYCSTRADPDVKKSEYLATIGNKLLPSIHIMWTGPKVVSKVISVQSIKELSEVIKRKPIIWDNIHANDYDQKRLFLGPFQGRSTDLRPYVSGVMTNPNCEYFANHMALHTLATWHKDSQKVLEDPVPDTTVVNPTISAEIELETEGEESLCTKMSPHGCYDPLLACKAAIADWLQLFYEERTVTGKMIPPVKLTHPDIPPTAPPVPSINTCMAVTIPTTSGIIDTDLQEAKPPVLDGIGHEDLKPPLTPVNSLVDPSTIMMGKDPDEPLEPMEVNNEFSSGPLDEGATVVPTKTSSNIPTDSIVSKVTDIIMQIDEKKPETKVDLIPPSSSGSVMSTPESEMQVDSVPPVDDNTVGGVLDTSVESLNEADSFPSKEDVLDVEDVELIVELFYLPYEHGSRGVEYLEEIHWLKSNAFVLHQSNKGKKPKPPCQKEPTFMVPENMGKNCPCSFLTEDSSVMKSEYFLEAKEWMERACKFQEFVKKVNKMLHKLLKIPNRGLLYDLYPYVWDMVGILSTIGSYIKWLGCTRNHREAFLSGDLEPWMFRGGLTGEFERMLPLEGAADLFFKGRPPTISTKVYTIRSYLPANEDAVYNVCRLTCDDCADGSGIFPDHPDLIADKLVGHFLTLSPEYCFVVVDGEEIVGYVCAAVDAPSFYKKFQVSWLEHLKRKYPLPHGDKPSPAEELITSFHEYKHCIPDRVVSRFPSQLRLDVLSSVTDIGVTKNLLACVLSALKSNGSCGVHVELLMGEKNQMECYTKLGFFELPSPEGLANDNVYLCRAI